MAITSYVDHRRHVLASLYTCGHSITHTRQYVFRGRNRPVLINTAKQQIPLSAFPGCNKTQQPLETFGSKSAKFVTDDSSRSNAHIRKKRRKKSQQFKMQHADTIHFSPSKKKKKKSCMWYALK